MKNLLVLLSIMGFALFIGLIDKYNTSDDDPNQDHIPSEYFGRITDDSREAAVITDESGYDNFDLGVDFAEPHLSMNPNNPLQSFTAYNTNGGHYTLNGIDWVSTNPNFSMTTAGDPATAYDSLGNLFYENMQDVGGNIVGTKVVKSTNNGVSWQTAVAGNTGNDKNWFAADQTGGPFKNYLYGTMTPGNIIRSTNNGASFSIVASVTNQSPGMMPAVGPNGSVQGGCVYVVTVTGSSTAHIYTFYRSTNGGTSFDLMSAQQFPNAVGDFVSSRNSVQNMRTRPYPFITADNSYGPNRGRLYVIYASNTPVGIGNKPDIFCRFSNDQGATWSGAVRVNDDANTESNNQWHPSTWCDKQTGRLYVKWMDTRDTPTSDSAYIYASYSDNGGTSFAANQRITTKKMKIDCSTCGGGGTPRYEGDYDAIASNSVTSLMAFTDFRNGNFGSYVAYFPDYAYKVNTSLANVSAGGSTSITASVPSVKLYDKSVKFTTSWETTPAVGTLTASFQSGRDSINSFPDSVKININASANVSPGSYNLRIEARGPNGTPAHRRMVRVLVNSSLISISGSRGSLIPYTVNGTQYTTPQQLVFTNGTSITVSTPDSLVSGSNRYVFTGWSDGGAATHTITVANNLTLVPTYKIQYKVIVISSPPSPNIFGNTFQDSAVNFNFGLSSNRIIISADSTYWFRGWNGAGQGSYTSPDSLGLDDTLQLSITNPIVETIRWSLNNPSPVGIIQVSSEIPAKFDLYQNYPNPFNPSTKIKFDLPQGTNVKITIFDVLGKEVETLVNEFRQAGRYEANFNASKLSSGIYYYRIETAEFTNVKKMLLIK